MRFIKKVFRQVDSPFPTKKLLIDPLTIGELDQAINKRIRLIKQEFKNGLALIKRYPKSVTFFGSARFKPDHPAYRSAFNLAQSLVKDNYAIVTGGGPGIMQAGNEGAVTAGGRSLGLTIKLPHEQVTNLFLTDRVGFYYFFIRKVCLTFSAEAFVFFPGGFGTLDELFEILTLIQTGKIRRAPIILVGREYWIPLDNFIKEELLKNYQAIDQADLGLYVIEDDIEKIVSIIKKAPVVIG